MSEENTKKNAETKEEAITEASSFGNSEPTDGRIQWDWKSKYPQEALSIIRFEAFFLLVLFFLALIMIFLTWTESLHHFIKYCCGKDTYGSFNTYSYITFSGLLAGVIFSVKYLYHAVARGTWHLDRQLWRFMSPVMSLGVAFIVGALVNANLMNGTKAPISAAAAVSIGFMAGYFSDTAIAKMYEIANVIFGTNKAHQSK